MSVNGITLFRHACSENRRQVAASRGRLDPRERMTASKIAPAMRVRAAIRLSGGIVSTPILMKV